MVHAIGERRPKIAGNAFVAWNAEVAGTVTVGTDASVWFGATVRGDLAPIEIGEGTNVQDGAVIHVDTGMPCVIGREVTVGHCAVIHSCRIGDRALVGMGAIILNGAEIGEECLVGAGALVTQGKQFPPRTLVVGSPARALRTLTDDEIRDMAANAAHYRALAGAARTDYTEV